MTRDAEGIVLAALAATLAALAFYPFPALAQPMGPPMTPGLTTGVPDNCEGSASGGVSTGMFGLSLGFTSPREDCNRRADARVLAAIGDRAAAEERLCESASIRAARLRAGRPCAADGGSAQPSAQNAQTIAPPRAGALEVKPLDVCGTLSSPAERRAYAQACGTSAPAIRNKRNAP